MTNFQRSPFEANATVISHLLTIDVEARMPNNSGALIITPHSTIPFERFLFGNENWRSHRAICEMEIYCDLLENLQDRIDSLETRGKDDEVALTNVQAVISSYAFEIALKSFWALDNPAECVPHSHEVTSIFDELKEETKKSLKQFQLTRGSGGLFT